MNLYVVIECVGKWCFCLSGWIIWMWVWWVLFSNSLQLFFAHWNKAWGVSMWCFEEHCELEQAANLFIFAPMPWQAPLPWAVPWKCHSNGISKYFSWAWILAKLFLFFKIILWNWIMSKERPASRNSSQIKSGNNVPNSYARILCWVKVFSIMGNETNGQRNKPCHVILMSRDEISYI